MRTIGDGSRVVRDGTEPMVVDHRAEGLDALASLPGEESPVLAPGIKPNETLKSEFRIQKRRRSQKSPGAS